MYIWRRTHTQEAGVGGAAQAEWLNSDKQPPPHPPTPPFWSAGRHVWNHSHVFSLLCWPSVGSGNVTTLGVSLRGSPSPRHPLKSPSLVGEISGKVCQVHSWVFFFFIIILLGHKTVMDVPPYLQGGNKKKKESFKAYSLMRMHLAFEQHFMTWQTPVCWSSEKPASSIVSLLCLKSFSLRDRSCDEASREEENTFTVGQFERRLMRMCNWLMRNSRLAVCGVWLHHKIICCSKMAWLRDRQDVVDWSCCLCKGTQQWNDARIICFCGKTI